VTRRSRQPRILLLVENVPIARDHRLRKLATTLLADGFRVTVICQRDERNADCLPGARVIDYPAPREGGRKIDFMVEYVYSVVVALFLTARVFVTEGFDVLQISSTPDIYWTVAWPYRLLGRRVVLDFKDLSPETYRIRFGATGLMYRILLFLERTNLRCANAVLVVNESLREIAVRRGGVAAEDTVVVGNGPALARVARRPARPQLRRGLAHLCVWVGMIGPQDRLDLAIRAFGELVHGRGRTDCGLTVMGIGDALPDAQRLVAELDLGRWITFHGWAEEDVVFDHLSTADLGIEPDVEDFVSPVKTMEFMAAALPFVAFDVRETVALAGPAAAYAPRADVAAMAALIDELLDAPERLDLMGRSGQDRVRSVLAWEHQGDRYLTTMRTLTGHAGLEAVASDVRATTSPTPEG
jgi:glycosyltransferase involved in cell wall biosynthesis